MRRPDRVMSQSVKDQRKRATVLVVEDEPAAREALTYVLSGRDFTVMAAATGEEAIEILWQHKERIDWLFTNIDLPGAVDGWRVAEEFRFAHPLRSVVYAATRWVDEPRPGATSLFVRKPYHPAHVAAALARLRRGGAREGFGFAPPLTCVPQRNRSAAAVVDSTSECGFRAPLGRFETVR